MRTENLYKLAEELGVKVDFFPLPEAKSLSVQMDDRFFVAIDPNAIGSLSAERVCLAHELGHCRTGSFYNIHAPLDNRLKHEHRANKWAINRLVPIDELRRAVKNGCSDIGSLAEHFSVTEEFIGDALKFYTEN